MFAICKIALVYSYVQPDFHVEDGSAYICLILFLTQYSYVKDESTKCLLYVKLHMFIFMSNMIFLCPGWMYKMFAICDIALVYSYVQHDFYAEDGSAYICLILFST